MGSMAVRLFVTQVGSHIPSSQWKKIEIMKRRAKRKEENRSGKSAEEILYTERDFDDEEDEDMDVSYEDMETWYTALWGKTRSFWDI